MRGRMVFKKKCVWVEEGVEAGRSQQLSLSGQGSQSCKQTPYPEKVRMGVNLVHNLW